MTQPAMDVRLPSPLQEVRDGRLDQHGVRLWLKRDDLIHPQVSGNKWRKLKYNLSEVRARDADRVLTFGGAYSNHLRAVAAAGHLFGFGTIGVVRGEENRPLNWSLQYCVDHGMRLVYLDRDSYRHKTEPWLIDSFRERFGDPYVLPEGGSNPLAVRGCAEIGPETELDFDYMCCPVGTGGTLAGLAAGLAASQSAIGFAALRGADFLRNEVVNLQRETFGIVSSNWTIELDYHFGGYAKRTRELDAFVEDFGQRHSVSLDWVYVAKMLAGIFSMVEMGKFDGRVVVALVTG